MPSALPAQPSSTSRFPGLLEQLKAPDAARKARLRAANDDFPVFDNPDQDDEPLDDTTRSVFDALDSLGEPVLEKSEPEVVLSEQEIDQQAFLHRLDDFLNDLISQEEHNAVNAAYSAKYPSPVSVHCEPQEESSSLLVRFRRRPHQSMTVVEFERYEAAKIATNTNAGNHAQPQVTHTVAQNPASTCPVVAALPSASTKLLPTSSASSSTTPIAANQNVRTEWSELNQVQKFGVASEAAEYHNGFAFSLNLSPARIKKLTADAANGDDPHRLLSHYINRELKKRCGYVAPYDFGFEYDHGGRLHAHGSVILGDKSEAGRKLLHKALSAAGGKIKGRSGSTQAHSVEIYDGARWFRYTTKSLTRTRRLLGCKDVTFISTPMTKIAREFNEPKSRRPLHLPPLLHRPPSTSPAAHSESLKRSVCF